MTNWQAVLIGALLLAGCGRSEDAVGLNRLMADPDKWDGETVVVDAWLLQCRGQNCHVLPTREDLELFNIPCPGEGCKRAIEAFDKRAVSVGFAEDFDRVAKQLEGKHVLLRARVNADQWTDSCLDRCNALQPISIAEFPNLPAKAN